MRALRQCNGIAPRALTFLLLTAARSGEVRGATWDEIDLGTAIWTIPAERMKAGKPHLVPLSDQALALLCSLPRFPSSIYVFPAPRGGILSDMALSKVMKRMDVEATPHGLRSTFRDWISENTNYPHEVAEQALAHVIQSAVERAYRRGDLLEKRRSLMADWAMFLDL
ncbi:tyrosine-type recombinase/integrase [Spiribacter roseus]|uniref:tyrosine-type recombinase/integrase n=1 Tax=Spiribacter roseus TaxID=1855875 RepID=UPI00296EADCD